jgi:hypothetical protein
VIGGSTPAAISGTTGQFGTSLNVDGTVTANGVAIDGDSITANAQNALTFEFATATGIISADRTGGNFGELSLRTTAGSTPLQRLNISYDGDISFYEDTGTTPKFFWDASAESLGIGTSSPAAKLHIDGGTGQVVQVGPLSLTNFADEGSGVIFGRTTDGALTQAIGTVLVDSLGVFGRENIVLATGGSGLYGATTERMRITSTGLVGIGTSSPLSSLVVAEGTGQHGFEVQPGTLTYVFAYDRATADYGDLDIAGQTLRFSTDNGVERMRIDASGMLNAYYGISVDGGTIKLDGNYPVGTGNVALGDGALDDGGLSGAYNTAVGSGALTANTTGQNDAFGASALLTNTTGTFNTAIGASSLFDNSSGSYNVAVGRNALENNTTASNNTAVGYQAGYSNTTGDVAAFGRLAMRDNTTGVGSTAMGLSSLLVNTTGSNNTAIGYTALNANTTADNNTAVGYQALYTNDTGAANTAVGNLALLSNTTGTNNTVVGSRAGATLTTGTHNTFIGSGSTDGAGFSVTTGSKNTILGGYTGNQGGLDIRTSDNNIVLSDGDGNPRLYFDSTGRSFFTWAGAVTARFQNTGADPYGLYVNFTGASPDNNTNYFLYCEDTTAARMIVYSDGDVVNHDNSYGGISDVKLKEQITNASSQWDDIKSLTVRKYKMKFDVAEKGDSDEHWRLGVIAQEVEAAGMSGLIKTSPDMIESENGELVESGEYTKQVKYSILYMKAVKALQEAMERIEQLEARLDAANL